MVVKVLAKARRIMHKQSESFQRENIRKYQTEIIGLGYSLSLASSLFHPPSLSLPLTPSHSSCFLSQKNKVEFIETIK